jgi:hypothetical protein
MKGISSRVTKSTEDKKRIDKIAKISKARHKFEQNCFWLLLSGYQSVYAKKDYNHDVWEENTYSANIVREMERLDRNDKRFGYYYNSQTPEYTEDFYKGIIKNTSRFYDFSVHFVTLENSKELIFGFEAKLITENDYLKKKAWDLRNEYISERGFQKFTAKLYKERGCMVAYVLEGKPKVIVDKINEMLENRDRKNDILKPEKTVNGCDFCYKTNHDSLDYPLMHFLLLFDNQENN